ncbi:MAG: PDZ domain-containing protein [Candidatus Acidiferrales bacterium]
MRDLLFLLLALSFSIRPAFATVSYEVSLDHPEQHAFHVIMTIPSAAPGTLVAIPAWNATYQIRDFGHRVRDVEAHYQSGEKLNVRKLDKQTWQIADAPASNPSPSPGELTVRYSIEWDDPGPFNSQLNAHHAFMNFAETLMYIANRRGEEVSVRFANVPAGWKTFAELDRGRADNSYVAANYDALVDAPFEAGKFEEFDFTSAGANFRVVVDAKDWNKGHLEEGLRRITDYQLKLMGVAPFKEYTFFFHIGPYLEVGGGGMEHSNCTAISAGSLEAAVAIASHEFFHTWNVKRIRPQAFEPVDFTKEQYTRALWFAEGVTSTYGAYTLERSGVYPKDVFYAELASQIAELQSRPAHKWQSAEESSLDTWYDKYDLYRQPDRSISYYNKGQILGVLLDLAIRDATDNHKSLDDVLRRLDVDYAQKGKFYNESEGIRAVVEEVSGKSFVDFFRRYVAGVREIPYADFFDAAGLELKLDSSAGADLGFRPSRAPGTGEIVLSVVPGSDAETAGLRAGDVLLNVDGDPFPRSVRAWLRNHKPGETVKLRFRRENKDFDISYALGSSSEARYSIVESAQPSDRQRRIRDGILHGTTD